MTPEQINALLEQDNICSRAICHYGEEAQRLIAIEEMSELTKELCKFSRDQSSRDKIADEVADVYICLSQIELMFRLHDTVQERMAFKLRRLEQRMDDEDAVMDRAYVEWQTGGGGDADSKSLLRHR